MERYGFKLEPTVSPTTICLWAQLWQRRRLFSPTTLSASRVRATLIIGRTSPSETSVKRFLVGFYVLRCWLTVQCIFGVQEFRFHRLANPFGCSLRGSPTSQRTHSHDDDTTFGFILVWGPTQGWPHLRSATLRLPFSFFFLSFFLLEPGTPNLKVEALLLGT